jgi:hypothetical protein
MGALFSQLHGLIKTILDLKGEFDQVKKRLERSSGLPAANPSTSFWMVPPSHAADHHSPIPDHVDIVIIGSGITGASLARTILNYKPRDGLSVLMLEARALCSGATGRYGYSRKHSRGRLRICFQGTVDT